jgi:hypothetical protein
MQRVPDLVKALEHLHIVHAAGGYSFSLAVTVEGEVWSWGFNDKACQRFNHLCEANTSAQFQCGHGHRFNQPQPARVRGLEGVKVVQVAGRFVSALSCGIAWLKQLQPANSTVLRFRRMAKSGAGVWVCLVSLATALLVTNIALCACSGCRCASSRCDSMLSSSAGHQDCCCRLWLAPQPGTRLRRPRLHLGKFRVRPARWSGGLGARLGQR